ncbi:MAG: glycogen synthase GlgA [Pirellulaceae bacterium]|nr:glycogen synthase GlgA [Pirellulaceae bacterium]
MAQSTSVTPLHIVFVSAEAVPLAKTGGLADVCGVLPRELAKLGHKCSLFIPGYRRALATSLPLEVTDVGFAIPMGGRHVACRLLKTQLPDSNVDVYLVDQPQYFDRDALYGDVQGDYRDNCERFSFFCRAVVHAIEQMDMHPDVVHCHDWQAGLVPAYVATGSGGYSWTKRCASIMTVHNLAYQGRFWHYDMVHTGLDWQYFNWKQMEFYGDLCFLKTGLVFSDAVTTVSPTYAAEIRTPEHGCALDGVLRDRGESLVGIVNGVDYQVWNPAKDRLLPHQYDVSNWRIGKRVCKLTLRADLGLADTDTVLIGIVSRLAGQKGWDLILPLMQRWLQMERPVQWVVLGTGEEPIESELTQMAAHSKSRVAVRLEFSEALAHRIEAASDIFLMPSRYEPCGLNQLYSLRYGTVPVVHATGGLVDTVVDANQKNLSEGIATGFAFNDYRLDELEHTLGRAVDVCRTEPTIWAKIVECGMRQDWSWQRSATQYVRLYEQTVAKKQSMG